MTPGNDPGRGGMRGRSLAVWLRIGLGVVFAGAQGAAAWRSPVVSAFLVAEALALLVATISGPRAGR